MNKKTHDPLTTIIKKMSFKMQHAFIIKFLEKIEPGLG